MGLDTKTYWLTDRQSQCDFDFDSDSDSEGDSDSVVQDIERDNRGLSTRTERIGARRIEEYRRSACEYLKCDLNWEFQMKK
jgi:hypothetical protein